MTGEMTPVERGRWGRMLAPMEPSPAGLVRISIAAQGIVPYEALAAMAIDNDSWTEQLRRGGLELAILLAVAPGSRYGLEIIRHLQEFTDLVVTEGTIYPILGRLARDGLLQAEWQAAAAHPRKYYRLTAAGRRRLRVMVDDWRSFASKIDRLVRAAGKEVGHEPL